MDSLACKTWVILVAFISVKHILAVTQSINDIWEITSNYGNGGFEGEIKIPIKSTTNSWKITIDFDTAVDNFQVFEAELFEESKNRTRYVVENLVWNANLQNGDELYFRIQGYTNGGLPNLVVTYKDTIYEKPYFREREPPIQPRELRKIINTDVDYERAIRLSMRFFEAQRSGFLPDDNRILWKKDSGLYDGGIEGVNLVGGYYLAGDYVKFNYPMAFAITQLAWGALEFGDGYESAGEMQNLFKAVKWGTDYFIKCHTEVDEYYGMIGDPDIDHKLWEKSEGMNWKRPAYKISPDEPGSDLAAETAAALAAASILFESISSEYSQKLITHAKQLWELGEQHRGRYDFSAIRKASEFYGSSDYDDELIWGALWLYRATKDKFYLDFAEKNYGRLIPESKNGFSYDDKLLGIQLLLADITDDYRTYMNPVTRFCENPGGNDAFVLPSGLLYKNVHNGPISFAANAAFICTIVARRTQGQPEGRKILNFAKSQIHIILGTGGKTNYMIGFGENYPENPHHRDSSCPDLPYECGWDFYHDTSFPNTRKITGALVGGPNEYGDFEDSRQNIDLNQPNLLYNSAFQSAAAGLIMFMNGDMENSGAGSGSTWDSETFAPASLQDLFSETGLETKFDACFSNPCQNKATCGNRNDMKFECKCEGNTYGELCQLKLNPEIQWVSMWPNGAQIHIHLPSKMYEGKKQLSLVFPKDCPLILVETWHACLVPSLTTLTGQTVVMQQIGWQTDQKFLGLKFEFVRSQNLRTCFKTANYRFKISEQENENTNICTKSIPEHMETEVTTAPKPVFEAIQPLKEDKIFGTDASFPDLESEVLPTQILEKKLPGERTGALFPVIKPGVLPTQMIEENAPNKEIEVAENFGLSPADAILISWDSKWSSGGQARLNVAGFRNSVSGPWILRLLLPPECTLSGAQFWHACTIPEMNNPGKGLFTFKQVSWQIHQNYVGMTLHFNHVIKTVDCFDSSLYHVIQEKSTTGSDLNPNSCKVNFEKQDMLNGEEPLPDVIMISDDASRTIRIDNDDTNVIQNEQPENLRDVWLEGTRPPPTKLRGVARLRAKPISPTTVQISWKRLKKKNTKKIQVEVNSKSNEDKNITKKENPIVKLKYSSSRMVRSPKRELDVSGRKNRMYIRDLQPGKTYVFNVRVKEGDFYGPSKAVTVALAPSDIENIRTTNPNETTIHFRWQKPPGVVKAYSISYFPETASAYPKSPFEMSGDDLETSVRDLAINTEYIFVFIVKNDKVASNGKYVFAKTGSSICKNMICPNNSECVQTDDGSECICNFGFEKSADKCIDTNECVEGKICDVKAECVNTLGSYECTCKLGYYGDGKKCLDVDECRMNEIEVCPGATCHNLDGSYQCKCDEGYIYKETSCQDIDECTTEGYRCPKNSKCKNTIGSYTCECPNGTKYFEDQCEDINECTENLHSCKRSETCANYDGSYKCLCRKGFAKTRRGCRDLNECRRKKNKCSEFASCRNTKGAYKCRCKSGYVGNGFLCKDENECTSPSSNDCDKVGGLCSNTEGSYVCSCKVGYTGDGKKCSAFM